MATGWTVRGSNPGGGEIYLPVQTSPGAHPASCTMGTVSFPGVKSGRCVTLTPHPILMPWPRKSRAIPLLLPWVVRPVQSLSACTSVHYNFSLYYNIMGPPSYMSFVVHRNGIMRRMTVVAYLTSNMFVYMRDLMF